MSIGNGGLVQLKQLLQVILGEMPFAVLVLVHHGRGERLLVRLPLENLLLNRSSLQKRTFNVQNLTTPPRPTHRHKAIDEARLLLSIAPHPRHRLLIIGRIPVRIEHHQPVGANQIQPATTRLRTQHKDEVLRVFRIERVHHFAALLDGHGAVQPHILVATFAAQPLEHVQRLGVVRHQHDLVAGVHLEIGQHAVQHHQLAAQLRPQVSQAVVGRH
jgi:hypothetical protein